MKTPTTPQDTKQTPKPKRDCSAPPCSAFWVSGWGRAAAKHEDDREKMFGQELKTWAWVKRIKRAHDALVTLDESRELTAEEKEIALKYFPYFPF